MRQFWIKDKLIEPQHPNKNPYEREMGKRKADMTNIMIDYSVNPREWFQVILHTSNMHNNRSN